MLQLRKCLAFVNTDQDSFLARIWELDRFHREQCLIYRNFVQRYFQGDKYSNSIESLPFIPVPFFKHFKMLSIPESRVYKTMRSSGTTGLQSTIFLDKDNAVAQIKALVNLSSPIIGKSRRLMVVLDKPSALSGRHEFSARTAGINGFRIFSTKTCFLFNDDDSINFDTIEEVQNEYLCNRAPFLYGFTHIIWQNLDKFSAPAVPTNLFNSAILIHGGGWKKLESSAITKHEFSLRCKQVLGVERVVDYYGMIEQVGSIFYECSGGFFHNTEFAKVLIRNVDDFSLQAPLKVGLIQCISILPKSYPGHSILTEDLGVQYRGSCICGLNTDRFIVLGRVRRSAIRGCSDAT